ncbi:MAG: SIMPL domain-containing protein [bacterium]|nr:SIMPL domain-containing protein [bacterium]
MIHFSIVVVREDALSAASDAAAIFDDIVTRLHDLNVEREDIVTTRFAVFEKKDRQLPRMEEVLIGYSSNHNFKVEIIEFKSIGVIVNAVLGAGATSVQNIVFVSSELGRAQQQALADAAKAAHQQAMTMASAVGGKLGRLLQMESERYSEYVEDSFGGGAVSVPVTIVPDRIVARMQVSAKWEYLPENK